MQWEPSVVLVQFIKRLWSCLGVFQMATVTKLGTSCLIECVHYYCPIYYIKNLWNKIYQVDGICYNLYHLYINIEIITYNNNKKKNVKIPTRLDLEYSLFYYFCVYIYVCVHVNICNEYVGIWRGQKTLEPLDLEFQATVSLLMQVLETELGPT